MARVTVEDCIEKVPNRFDLVLLAAHRSRNIAAGSELTIDRDNDKTPVVVPEEEEEAPVLALGHGDVQAPAEMSEADLLRALQGDRDNDSSSRF